uniref:Copine domain-containing protein n=1 Tax=Globodera pallida TaxID=36090 RepID=A0A183BU42_GLOPA
MYACILCQLKNNVFINLLISPVICLPTFALGNIFAVGPRLADQYRELRLLCFQRNSAKSPAGPPPPPVSLGEFPLFYRCRAADRSILGGAFEGLQTGSNSYPAFGFGAKIPPQFRESQEFCLNLDGTDPYCRGISGVFSAFKSSFTKVEPLNMAHLSHVIYYMAKLAQNSLCRLTPANNCVEELGSEGKPPNYFVLVIVTRGIFDDLKETVQSLIFASRAPLSIVFVGIGEDEQHLGELERLATAGTRLNFHGRKPERDYTQYVSVPLCRKEESKTNDLKIAVVERGLSAVSAQMCNWMMRNGYQKLEPVPETGTIQQAPTPPPTSAAHAPSFEDNGGDAWPSDGSCRTPTPFRHGIRMRQSAQCLSLGRSSSSSSFGSSNKLFGGGIYSSAPESALEITSAVAGPTSSETFSLAVRLHSSN